MEKKGKMWEFHFQFFLIAVICLPVILPNSLKTLSFSVYFHTCALFQKTLKEKGENSRKQRIGEVEQRNTQTLCGLS